MNIAKKLGLDDTFIYIDPVKGWKISHFIEDASTLNYHNEDQVRTAMNMLRRLHTSGMTMHGKFDIRTKINDFIDKLQDTDITGFGELQEMMQTLYGYLCHDEVAPCPCHCDSYDRTSCWIVRARCT